METRKTEDIKKPFALILLTLLGLFIVLTSYQKQHWDTDIFWALEGGKWIVENLEVPRTDPFSHTFGGEPWIDFTWGFQVIAHIFYTYLGGWWGLFMLQLAITSTTFFLLYRNLSLLTGNRLWLCILLLYIVFAASHGRFFIRPHLFGYLFVTLYLLFLNLYERNGDYRYLVWLVPFQALWVNIHSSFVLGIFIVWAYAFGALAGHVRERGLSLEVPGEAKGLLYASLLLPLATLLNPYGPELAFFPFVHTGGENVDALRHIAEWTRIPLNELVFYLYPLPINMFAFKVLFIFTALTLALNFRKLNVRDLVLFAAVFYLAATHVRWVALFAYFAAPVLALNASRYLEASGRSSASLNMALRLFSIFLAAFLTLNLLHIKDRADYGTGLKTGVYPEGAVGFIKSEGIEGNIYNEYVFGGYLIHNNIKVFIDGRTPTVYSPYFFWQTRVIATPARWKRLVAEYGITVSLVKIKDDFCEKLWKSEEWTPVFFDDVSVLYLKSVPEHEGAISKWGLQATNPCANAPRYELPGDEHELGLVREELKRVIDYISEAGLSAKIARAHRLLGLVDMELGEQYYEEAAGEFRRSLEIIDDPNTYYDLGLLYMELKRYDEAAAAFEGSLKIVRGHLGLGLAYHNMEDHERAVEYLEKYIVMADDESEHPSYKALGFSCFELGRLDCAVRNLKRAAFTTDEKNELANIYYRLGNAFMEQRAYEKGAVYYQKAMEVEPEYMEVLKSLSESFLEMGRTDKAEIIQGLLGPE